MTHSHKLDFGPVGWLAYLSVHNVDAAPHLPHFGSKIAVEIAIKASGVPFTILRPNNFHQNDSWFKDAMLKYGVNDLRLFFENDLKFLAQFR